MRPACGTGSPYSAWSGESIQELPDFGEETLSTEAWQALPGGPRRTHDLGRALQKPSSCAASGDVEERTIERRADLAARRRIEALQSKVGGGQRQASGEHREERRDRRRLPPDFDLAAARCLTHVAEIYKSGLLEVRLGACSRMGRLRSVRKRRLPGRVDWTCAPSQKGASVPSRVIARAMSIAIG